VPRQLIQLLQIPRTGHPGDSAAQIQIAGLTNFTGGLSAIAPQLDPFTSWQAYDDASFVKGIHSLQFGANYEFMRDSGTILLDREVNSTSRRWRIFLPINTDLSADGLIEQLEICRDQMWTIFSR